MSLVEAKRHLNLAEDDNAHNESIEQYLAAATEQFETDINTAILERTMQVVLPRFDCFSVSKGPLKEVSLVTFRDTDGTTQTLSPSKYSADRFNHVVRFESNLPSTMQAWNAVTVNYVIGSGNVKKLHKSAILLMAAYYFENRDMLENDVIYRCEAYERICKLLHRGSYP